MKYVTQWFRYAIAVVTFSCLSFLSFAQDKGVDVNLNVKKEGEWYQQAWVWILGGAIFILLLVAILRGGGKKDA